MYDFAIVGARCAGSALALMFARAGAWVLVRDGLFAVTVPCGETTFLAIARPSARFAGVRRDVHAAVRQAVSEPPGLPSASGRRGGWSTSSGRWRHWPAIPSRRGGSSASWPAASRWRSSSGRPPAVEVEAAAAATK